MKTSIKTITTICTVVISLSVTAQNRGQGNHHSDNQKDNSKLYASAGYSNWGPWGGGFSVTVGNYPNYGSNYYYGNGYNNYKHIKKAARNSIRQSAYVIGQALQFTEWNDIYSPWLAKAIRHQQYAKQLYFWGNYAGALNHAERAGFLASHTLNYFNGYYGYGDGFGDGYNNYPNPYGDPNNPYYRKTNPSNTSGNMNENASDDDFGYRKGSTGINSTDKETNTNSERKLQKEEIDATLPQNKMSDKELLKINPKDLDVE